MKITYPKVKSFEIKRRTFEGRTDPTKNDNSLTSKYMPSYKYWVKIKFEDGSETEDTKPTKQLCLNFVEHRKSIAGKQM